MELEIVELLRFGRIFRATESLSSSIGVLAGEPHDPVPFIKDKSKRLSTDPDLAGFAFLVILQLLQSHWPLGIDFSESGGSLGIGRSLERNLRMKEF